MRCCIVTGGTGGHIYPALALANELKKKNPETAILFIGSDDRMEKTEIPAHGYAFEGIHVQGMNGGLMAKLKSLWLIEQSKTRVATLLKDFRPDIVVGFGNYISVPVIQVAHKMGIPTLIHEQNSYAGKANRLLAKIVDGVVGCYEENLQQFPPEKTRLLGNPRATGAQGIHKDPALLNKLGLNPELPLVILVMGSLGSESVNATLLEAVPLLEHKSYQTLIVTGKKWAETFGSVPKGGPVHVTPYIEGLPTMACSDLVVIRGGATTLAEVCALGLPSVIIPSPYVPNNHQLHNAKALERVGAAQILEEKDLSAPNLVDAIDHLMNHDDLRQKMAQQAQTLGKPQAAEDMITWMESLVEQHAKII